MYWQYTPYGLPLFVATMVLAGVAALLWRRRSVPSAFVLLVLVLALMWWTLINALELSSTVLWMRLFLLTLRFISGVSVPVLWFVFVLYYVGYEHWLTRRTIALMVVLALAMWLLVATNNLHKLVGYDYKMITNQDGLVVLDYKLGNFYFLFLAYAYSFLLGGVLLLLRAMVRSWAAYRGQIVALLIAGLAPFATNFLYFLGVLDPHIDLISLAFTVSSLAFFWATYRYRLFDIVPAAREAVVESMVDAVIVLDSQNRVVDMNPAAQRLMMTPAQQVIGQPVTALDEEAAAWLDSTLDQMEIVLGDPPQDYDLRISPFYQQDKHVGSLMVLRDITQHKQAERKLRRAHEQSLALSQLKDEFVSNVSHELRTPLANLKLYHELMARRPERLDAYLQTVERETERLERTIEDLLFLSRLDQQRVAWQPQRLDLNHLLDQYVSDRILLADGQSVQLTWQPAGPLPPVLVDEGLMTQALDVLLTNAINYTPAGGQITFSTGMKERDGACWVGLSVDDSGLGMVPDDQAHLFERFFRGEAARQSGAAGTGLGLSILKKIVDQHQGDIEVFSEGVAGRGTTFTVWLPAAD